MNSIQPRIDTLAKIEFNSTRKHYEIGHPRDILIILGSAVGLNRNAGLAAYWNEERHALRLLSPSSIKPWRTIAQGLVPGTGMDVLGSYIASITPEHSVALVSSMLGTMVYINRPDASGTLRWQQLRVREDHNTDWIWTPPNPDSLAYDFSVPSSEAGVKIMSNPKTIPTSDSKFEAVKQVLVAESQEALWRSAATQATCTARDLLLAAARKAMPKQRLVINQIGKVLRTPMGEAAFGYALGMALEIKAAPGDLKRKRLASELRIGGEAAALNVVINPIREFLTGGIDTILNGIEGLSLPEVSPAALPSAAPTASFTETTQRESATTSRE